MFAQASAKHSGDLKSTIERNEEKVGGNETSVVIGRNWVVSNRQPGNNGEGDASPLPIRLRKFFRGDGHLRKPADRFR
jgi:hypothetical protein